MQDNIAIDSASLMARYGTMLALGSSFTGGSLAAAASPIAPVLNSPAAMPQLFGSSDGGLGGLGGEGFGGGAAGSAVGDATGLGGLY